MGFTIMAKYTLQIPGPIHAIGLPEHVEERGEGQQICRPKRSPAGGDDVERIAGRKTRPRHGDAADALVVHLVPDPIPVSVAAHIHQHEGLAPLGMKRMGDPNPALRIIGAGCIWR